MGEERVTVLIPSYNPGSYLVDALKSIFQQNYQDWKVIVVDDGPTTIAWMKRNLCWRSQG